MGTKRTSSALPVKYCRTASSYHCGFSQERRYNCFTTGSAGKERTKCCFSPSWDLMSNETGSPKCRPFDFDHFLMFVVCRYDNNNITVNISNQQCVLDPIQSNRVYFFLFLKKCVLFSLEVLFVY